MLFDRFLRFAGVSPVSPSAGVFGGFGGKAAAAGVAPASSKKSTADARAFFFDAAGVTGTVSLGAAALAGVGADVVMSDDSAAAASEARAFLRFSFFADVTASDAAGGAG